MPIKETKKDWEKGTMALLALFAEDCAHVETVKRMVHTLQETLKIVPEGNDLIELRTDVLEDFFETVGEKSWPSSTVLR